MNIEENNKLISEFMEIEMFGEEKDHTEALLICSALDLPVNPCTHFENVQETVYLDDMKFDSSWDWLMPVVEKIESLERLGGIVTIVQGQCKITSRMAGDHSVYSTKSYYMEKGAQGKLQATYEAIIEFISWYNKQK